MRTWIRLTKKNTTGIPDFYLPGSDEPFKPKLFTYTVKFPNESVMTCDIRAANVFTFEPVDKRKEGVYYCFEIPFNGMTLIYELHEVHLLKEEAVDVEKPVKRVKKAA